jgi:hypothetical protein
MSANLTLLQESEKCVFDRTSAPKQSSHSKEAEVRALEQTVDERCQCGTLCEDEQTAEHQQEDNNRGEPPLFIEAQKIPELFDNRELIHVACQFGQVAFYRRLYMFATFFARQDVARNAPKWYSCADR